MYDEKFMRRAIALVGTGAGMSPAARPYGAVVVRTERFCRRRAEPSRRRNFRSDLARRGRGHPRTRAANSPRPPILSARSLYVMRAMPRCAVATMLMAGIARMYYGATAGPVRADRAAPEDAARAREPWCARKSAFAGGEPRDAPQR